MHRVDVLLYAAVELWGLGMYKQLNCKYTAHKCV